MITFYKFLLSTNLVYLVFQFRLTLPYLLRAKPNGFFVIFAGFFMHSSMNTFIVFLPITFVHCSSTLGNLATFSRAFDRSNSSTTCIDCSTRWITFFLCSDKSPPTVVVFTIMIFESLFKTTFVVRDSLYDSATLLGFPTTIGCLPLFRLRPILE